MVAAAPLREGLLISSSDSLFGASPDAEERVKELYRERCPKCGKRRLACEYEYSMRQSRDSGSSHDTRHRQALRSAKSWIESGNELGKMPPHCCHTPL